MTTNGAGRGGEAAADGETGGLVLLLAVEDERWEKIGIPDLDAFVGRAARAALSGAGLDPEPSTELSVTLADDAAVAALNVEWRGKGGPTNILSFPMTPLRPGAAPGLMLGDLVLAFDTLIREAKAENKSAGDHLAHLLVHGTLHCLGFDHDAEHQAEAMEALERRVLARLGVPDPYAEPPEAARPNPLLRTAS